MRLNAEKTSVMIFNFTYNYQFSTRLYLQDTLLNIVNETKLLGTWISSDLTWWKNTNYITRKAFQKLEIVRRLYEFNVSLPDLVLIYTLYVRSTLEFNCCVWHYNITKEETDDIERVQKVACRVILKKDFISYENALSTLNLTRLAERRNQLCKKFALSCLKQEKSKDMFPLNPGSNTYLRQVDKYKVNFAKTGRLLNSAIPQMQRLLNEI